MGEKSMIRKLRLFRHEHDVARKGKQMLAAIDQQGGARHGPRRSDVADRSGNVLGRAATAQG
jgi:hypothetical protein